MPSPIAHAAVGYLIYRAARPRMAQEALSRVGPVPQLLLATVGLSLLPDLDSVVGVLANDLGRFHNNFTNSISFAPAVALGVGTAVWLRRRSGFRRWFIVALLCYETHVLMDYFTLGRGVMLAWPFSPDRFEPPLKLFYGLHWSYGWLSAKHFLTLATELGFVGLVALITQLFPEKRRAKAGAQSRLS